MKEAMYIRLLAIVYVFASLVLAPLPLYAATTGTIQGTVQSLSGTPLKDVKVTVVGIGQTTTTDKNGYFIFTGIQPGTYTIEATLVTYKPADSQVTVTQDNTTNTELSLAKETIKTGTSRVLAAPVRRTDPTTQYTLTSRNEQLQKTNPNNIYQFTGLVWGIPGVELDGAGYVHLRGDDENQTGFMIDGVPIMDSTSNQFFTNTVSVGMRTFNLVMGGADASYGGALGGYVNEVVGNGKDFAVDGKQFGGHAEYSAGPGDGWNYQATHNTIGGMLPGGKLDYYFSTIMYKNQFPGNTLLTELASSFDGVAKFNYYADPKDTFTFYASQGFEDYYNYQPYSPSLTPLETIHFDSGGATAVDTGQFQQDHQVQHYWMSYAGYKHSFTPRSFLSYRLFSVAMPSEFHLENTSGAYERTSPSELGNQLDYTDEVTPQYQLRAGLLYLQQKNDFNTIASFFGAPMEPLGPDNPFYYDSAEKVKPTQTAVYLTNELKTAGDKLTLDLGARYAQQHYELNNGLPNYTDSYLDPRVAAAYSPTRDLVFRSSYTVMSQFPETSFIEYLPPGAVGDTVTALPGVDPQSGMTYAQEQALTLGSINAPFNRLGTEHDSDFDLGVEKAFEAFGGGYDFSVTGYQRKYYDEIEQNVVSEPITYDNSAHGHSSGVEMLLAKRMRKPTDWNGFVSYTNQVVKATSGFFDTFYVPYYYQAFHGVLQQNQLNAGDNMEFPTSYDQRHTIGLVADKRVSKWFEVTGVVDAGSGYPFQNTLGTFTAAVDAQHAVFSNSPNNLFAQVPITMPDLTSLQPFNPTPGMSGWHYKFTLNTRLYVTPTLSFFAGIDNLFNSHSVLIYGTSPYNGAPFYIPPSPQYPQGRVYYGPRAVQSTRFFSFGVRTDF